MSQASAGWYTDPSDASRLRWFDGTRWTEHVHAQVAAAPPATATAGYGAPAYGTPAYAAPVYGAPASQSMPAAQMRSDGCQVCGAVPAIPVTLHEHQGMVLMQRFKTYRGQWCRDCGHAQFRHVQAQTLLLGWWGIISFFVNFASVGQNIGVYNKLRSLGAPVGRVRAPLPTGRSVFASPGFLVSVALIGLVLFVILR